MASVKNSTNAVSDPAKALPKSAWWHRSLEPEVRRRVLNDLAVTKIEGWIFRFTVMTTLSVIVAVMGLLLNSAAVVIGAMLLAPLMQPVLATAAAASMALFSKSLGALAKVIVATIWCVGIAYLISKILPNPELTDEVMSRTRPDFRDLIVALAAGAAGAYATVREDVSSSLPGVAVAVALVPPLGAVGIALSVGDLGRAMGALLLYTTNLVAIVLAGVFVFVTTGLVPPRRLANNARRLGVAVAGMIFLVAAIGWPLIQVSIASAQESKEKSSAATIVDSWLILHPSNKLEGDVEIDKEFVRIRLRGTGQPPQDVELKEQLKNALGDREVRIEWVRVATLEAVEIVEAEELSDELREEAEVVIEDWFKSREKDYQIDNVILEGEALRIDASGVGESPSIDELSDLLHEEVDENLEARLNWTERKTVTVGQDEVSPLEFTKQQMIVAVEKWASLEQVIVYEFSYDGELVLLDLAGPDEPDASDLLSELEVLAGKDILAEVYFTERKLLLKSAVDSLEDEEIPVGGDEEVASE